MMDQASPGQEWHTPAHVELRGAELVGILALGPMIATEDGDGCKAEGNVGVMTFAQWSVAFTSEEKHQFTLEQIQAFSEDGDWTFRQRQAAELYFVDPAEELAAAKQETPFFNDSLVDELDRKNSEKKIITRRADEITPQPIVWRWKHWLACGKLQLIGGVPEAGKSTIAYSFAAIVSSGGTWPDGVRATVGNVLVWTSEDDAADTVVPRLTRMGADLSRIHIIEQTREKDGKIRPFNPATDLAEVEAKARVIGDVALLILDPVALTVPPSRNSHNQVETRAGLQPVVNLIEAIKCAGIGVAHLTKGTAGKDPLERINGSGAFGQVPRLVMFASKNQAEGDDEPERIMVRVKSNIGPSGGGFGYHIDAAPLLERPDIEATRIVWELPLEGSARELLDGAEGDQGGKVPKVEQAKRFLQESLAKGERPQTEVFAAALAEGISEITLRRAAKGGWIGKRKEGMAGGWVWWLT